MLLDVLAGTWQRSAAPCLYRPTLNPASRTSSTLTVSSVCSLRRWIAFSALAQGGRERRASRRLRPQPLLRPADRRAPAPRPSRRQRTSRMHIGSMASSRRAGEVVRRSGRRSPISNTSRSCAVSSWSSRASRPARVACRRRPRRAGDLFEQLFERRPSACGPASAVSPFSSSSVTPTASTITKRFLAVASGVTAWKSCRR